MMVAQELPIIILALLNIILHFESVFCADHKPLKLTPYPKPQTLAGGRVERGRHVLPDAVRQAPLLNPKL